MSSSSIERAQEEILELIEAGKSISGVVNHWIQQIQVIVGCCSNKESTHRICRVSFTIVDYLEAIVPPEGV